MLEGPRSVNCSKFRPLLVTSPMSPGIAWCTIFVSSKWTASSMYARVSLAAPSQMGRILSPCNRYEICNWTRNQAHLINQLYYCRNLIMVPRFEKRIYSLFFPPKNRPTTCLRKCHGKILWSSQSHVRLSVDLPGFFTGKIIHPARKNPLPTSRNR